MSTLVVADMLAQSHCWARMYRLVLLAKEFLRWLGTIMRPLAPIIFANDTLEIERASEPQLSDTD